MESVMTKTKTKTRARLCSLLHFALFLGGCVAPWPALETCPEEGCAETDTVADTQATSSVTGDPTPSESSTTGTTGGDSEATSDASTDGPPVAPHPAVVGFSLSTNESKSEPLVIQKNGPIHVYAETTEADGLRVELDDGTVIDLTEETAGVFRGELGITSSLLNGDHAAKLVPFREDYGDGESVLGLYTVELPMRGGEVFWAVDEYLGKGWVEDVEVLENGDVLELGTLLDDDNERSCFLRRRSPLGAYGPADVVTLLGGDPCEAVGLEVHGDQILVLATWTGNGGRWWLGEMPMKLWGTIFPIAQGEVGDTATAVALREDGTMMVCGSTPSGFGDLDAFAWVQEWGQLPVMRRFDYIPNGEPQPHKIDETPRDALFVGDQFVMVGETYGVHDPENPDAFLTRRFFLPIDLPMGDKDDPTFVVAAGEGPGNDTQSIATAADIDNLGRLLVTGFTCGEFPCEETAGHLWVHELDGKLDWFALLGPHNYPELAPTGVDWHPAGYTVIGSGGLGGDTGTFMLRAFTIGDYEPLWTYTRTDPLQEHFPMAVDIGPYGQICAGGLGSGAYPGVACVGS